MHDFHGTSLRNAGLVLGVGLGGFVDGIVLHQLLGWHHMLSSVYPPDNMANMRINEIADGLFHAGMWVVTLIGVFMLFRARRSSAVAASPKLLVGALVAGFGLFNLAEGLVDHIILGIHHVRPGPNQAAWDIGFLVVSALLVTAGWWLLSAGMRQSQGNAAWRGPL